MKFPLGKDVLLTSLLFISQEEKFDEVKEKALRIGASAIEVVDVRREFVTELLWPAIQWWVFWIRAPSTCSIR